MNHRSKSDYQFDISIKMLYLAGRLLQERGNFERIPDWLVETLGVGGSALGILAAKQRIVYFSRADLGSEAGSVNIAEGGLWCSCQNLFANRDVPCHLFDCPVRQRMLARCGRTDLEVTCFPMAGKRGFLMVCGETLLLNSFPVIEIHKAITHFIACSLEPADRTREAASYFLPSEKMAQMWSEMLAGLSHDLRTPLACIKGYVTTLLREDVTWDQAMVKEFMNIIVEETDHIESLINNLLDSATFSWKGEIELKKEPVSLPQIVKKVLRDPSYQIKNHRFTVLFAEGFPLVEADPIRIEQVLRNLIDNAVKYSMENTRIVVKGEIEYGEAAPGEVIVSVTDRGIGIDSEHLRWLFEKFFRVNNGIQENKKGMGLGLPLVRQILIGHGGRIWAESKLNQGTTFYFTLPLGRQTAKMDSRSESDLGV